MLFLQAYDKLIEIMAMQNKDQSGIISSINRFLASFMMLGSTLHPAHHLVYSQ